MPSQIYTFSITDVTELENVDMMAEDADVKVKVMNRQSIDTTANFSSEDSRFKCWCHDVFDPNRRPDKCSPGLDETMLSKRISILSIKSVDSGYASRKCTGIFLNSECE